MPKTSVANIAPTENHEISHLEHAAGTFSKTNLLAQYLSTKDLARLNVASKTTQQMTADALKKRRPEELLLAVAFGNEALARRMVTNFPEALLDSSAIVTDISGKEIKGLTPLQAAICAGDVDMVQMMSEVLQQKLKAGVKLSFVPENEISRQITAIYPNGLDPIEEEQIAKAQEFKNQISENIFNLNRIFAEINAAQNSEVQAELDNPGLRTDNQLNAALHNFRQQFTDTANQELIFNPFYLLKAFEFYNEKFNDFTGYLYTEWNRKDLFWRQVIGYIQRHLPACYLQGFAQGIYGLIKEWKKLERNFEFERDKGLYMRAVDGYPKSLGYGYAVGLVLGRASNTGLRCDQFQNFLLTKKSALVKIFTPQPRRDRPVA